MGVDFMKLKVLVAKFSWTGKVELRVDFDKKLWTFLWKYLKDEVGLQVDFVKGRGLSRIKV